MSLLLLTGDDDTTGTGRWQAIVTAVKSAVGATTDSDARAWALEAARRLNSRAEFLTAPVAIATTTAGTAEYALGSTFVDLAGLRVNGLRYTRATLDEIDDLATGDAYISQGSGRLFAPSWSSTGEPMVKLYPAPEQDGLPITGREVIDVPAPTNWSIEDPPFPSDFDAAVRHGAIATGLSLKDEQLDAAQWHEDRFLAATQELKRRAHSRVGSGPVRIRVAGRDIR